MKYFISIILILITSLIRAQVLIECTGKISRGAQVYGMGLSLSDTTIKELTFVIKSGNQGNAFCFGKPDLFDKGLPDHTGMLYIYNPEAIIKSGSGSVWMLEMAVYDAKTGKVVYKCKDGLLFPVIVKTQTGVPVDPVPIPGTGTTPTAGKTTLWQKLFR